jgi:hypothetical protein
MVVSEDCSPLWSFCQLRFSRTAALYGLSVSFVSQIFLLEQIKDPRGALEAVLPVTEVGEPQGRGRLQTDHAQRWNEGRWTAAGQPSEFIQNQRESRNGTSVFEVTVIKELRLTKFTSQKTLNKDNP